MEKGRKNVETPSKVESVDSTKVKEKVDTVNVDFPKKKIKVKKLQKAENKSHNEKKTTSTVGEEATRRKERR